MKTIITHGLFCSRLLMASGFILLTACGATNPPTRSAGHLRADENKNAEIPALVTSAPRLKRPQNRPPQETYSVVVNQVPVREVLFSMARNAHINLNIDNDVKGKITMNAIDQTLPKILDRIAEQTDIVYSFKAGALIIKKDTPVLRTYEVNYLNIERSSKGKVSISTEIGTAGGGIKQAGSSSGSGGRSSGNKASTEVINEAKNQFWDTLAKNIAGILDDNAKENNGASNNEETANNNIIVNRETGIIAVRATLKQHKLIRAFIHKVVSSAQRQVLIEVTVAEVKLSDQYQAGVDWSVLGKTTTINNKPILERGGVQKVLGANFGSAAFFQLAGTGTVNGNPLAITLKALETFGDVKVLSSPKVMALNNQTAILKVVDNEVYFTTNVTINSGSVNQNSTTAVNTSINTVPVGFIMSVTPFIDSEDEVTLNVRPTISRIIRFVNDPNPQLAALNVVSKIPVIQVREIETMLKIKNKDTAVIGGLMQNQLDKTNEGVPILSSIPFLGNLFSYKSQSYVKTELVIFIRPVVIHDASLNGDLSQYKKYLNMNLNGKDKKLRHGNINQSLTR